MDKFTIADNKGREIFKNFLKDRFNIDNVKYAGAKDVYDLSFEYKGINFITEIKVRDDKYLNADTLYLDLKKYCHLMALQRNKTQLLYVNIFSNCLYIFNLTKIDFNKVEFISQYCNKTTAVKSYKIKKSIWNLNKNIAKRYDL